MVSRIPARPHLPPNTHISPQTSVETLASYNTGWDMKPEITYIEFFFLHLSCLSPCWIDWHVFFWPRKSVTERGCLTRVPVFIVFVNNVPKEVFCLKWASLPAAMNWGINWSPGLFSLPLSPQTLRLGTQALQYSATIFLVRVSAMSSGRFCIAQDSELDSKQENQMLLSPSGPDPGNWN